METKGRKKAVTWSATIAAIIIVIIVAWAGGLVFTVGFTLLIWVLGPLLQPFLNTLLPDQGPS